MWTYQELQSLVVAVKNKADAEIVQAIIDEYISTGQRSNEILQLKVAVDRMVEVIHRVSKQSAVEAMGDMVNMIGFVTDKLARLSVQLGIIDFNLAQCQSKPPEKSPANDFDTSSSTGVTTANPMLPMLPPNGNGYWH